MKRIVLTRRAAAALLCGTLLATTACAANNSGSDENSTTIVVGAYPFEFAASRVAGEYATVTNLLAPGSDGHDLELSPKQVAAVGKASLVVYQSGYQAAFDSAVSQEKPANTLDTATFLTLRSAAEDGADHDHQAEETTHSTAGHDDHGAYDPHVWLNPLNVAEIGEHIAAELGKLQPDHAAAFEANAEQLTKDLAGLDESYRSGLTGCRTDTFVTNHAAFGYLAAKYQLHQVGISGLSTEQEPSPARIAEVQQIAKAHQLTTIFYETAVSPKVAQSIASDLGLQTAVLDPVETLSPDSPGSDYIEVMNANLTELRKANGCQ